MAWLGIGSTLASYGSTALNAIEGAGAAAAPYLQSAGSGIWDAANAVYGNLPNTLVQGGEQLAGQAGYGPYSAGVNLPAGISGAGPATPLSGAESGLMQPQAGSLGAPAASAYNVQTTGAATGAGTEQPAPNNPRDLIGSIFSVLGAAPGFDQVPSGASTTNRVTAAPLGMPGQLQAPVGGNAPGGNRIGIGMNGLLTWMPSVPQAPQVAQIPGLGPPLGAYRGGM